MRRPWALALFLTAGLDPIGTLEAQVVYSDLRTRMGCAEYANESQDAYDARCDEEDAAARKASQERYESMVATQRAVAALRKKLDKEPALPASKNPLLGRWRRELVATLADGVRLTLEDVPAEYVVKETYALPKQATKRPARAGPDTVWY